MLEEAKVKLEKKNRLPRANEEDDMTALLAEQHIQGIIDDIFG